MVLTVDEAMAKLKEVLGEDFIALMILSDKQALEARLKEFLKWTELKYRAKPYSEPKKWVKENTWIKKNLSWR